VDAAPYAPVARVPGSIEIERLRATDLPAVLDLVNADRPPGQPACNRQALDMALRGESFVDADWWRELANVQAVVARRDGVVAGAASFAVAPAGRSGWLLWLHAREDRPVVETLVDHVLNELSSSRHLYAFWIATALTVGVEALPSGRRPVTHEVLLGRGLVGRDSWQYLVAPLPQAIVDAGAEEIAAVMPTSAPGEVPTWRLTVGEPEGPIASAQVTLGREGCGVLWWLEVEPGQRGRGIGRRLLLQALRFLALRGACTVAAAVDREGDRRPALRLFASVGFEEADRLWSYESPRKR
jgi:GNAT superfamily N-acetyltransferase